MHKSVKTGITFGITSGIITTLGLMVGMAQGTGSSILVIGSILTIAVADALSDSLGIHISEEADPKNSIKDVWTATISTFFAKFSFTLIFIFPILLFDLNFAVIVNVIFGIFAMSVLSFMIARSNDESPFRAIFEHVFITLLVIAATYYIGEWISLNFA